MFFPSLKSMLGFGFDEQLYNKLDFWLGTRGVSDVKYLSPVKFGIDTNIAEEAAIAMFAVCTLNEIDILRPKFCVRCPVCDYPAREYYQLKEVTSSIVLCDACGLEVPARPAEARIWFELIKSPEASRDSEGLEKSKGNCFSYEDDDYGLCPDKLKNSPNDLLRRVARNMNLLD